MTPESHLIHCCVLHGCKYGDSDCPVITGFYSQKTPCIDCLDNTVIRPWGLWTVERNVIAMHGGCQQIKTKILCVAPGKSLSRQKHEYRSEFWTVLDGEAHLELFDTVYHFIKENQTVFIPVGVIHKLSNNGNKPLIINEIQYGEICDEEDIIRYDQ